MTRRLLACCVLLASGGIAAADANKDKADALFKQGKKLMSQKSYSEACQAFEESFKLDPGIGGELNIARCYEEWGKLGRAFKAYQKAEQMALDAHDGRAPKIEELVKGIEPQVPKLTLRLKSGEAKDVTATLDGQPVDTTTLGRPMYLDPGPHTIEYKNEAGETKKKIVPVERAGTMEVVVEAGPPAKDTGGTKGAGEGEGKGGNKHEEPETRRAANPDPGRNMRIAGLAVGGAGIVAIGVASYMTLSARSKYNDALAKYCGNMTNNCDDTGLSLTHDARHEANIATAVFLIGTAAVGGGVALYLLAPKPAGAGHARREKEREEARAIYVVPVAAPDYGCVVLGGRL